MSPLISNSIENGVEPIPLPVASPFNCENSALFSSSCLNKFLHSPPKNDHLPQNEMPPLPSHFSSFGSFKSTGTSPKNDPPIEPTNSTITNEMLFSEITSLRSDVNNLRESFYLLHVPVLWNGGSYSCQGSWFFIKPTSKSAIACSVYAALCYLFEDDKKGEKASVCLAPALHELNLKNMPFYMFCLSTWVPCFILVFMPFLFQSSILKMDSCSLAIYGQKWNFNVVCKLVLVYDKY